MASGKARTCGAVGGKSEIQVLWTQNDCVRSPGSRWVGADTETSERGQGVWRTHSIWESKGNAETTDPEYLCNNHRAAYSDIPDDVVCLTIGGGTQKDCVFLELTGWTALAGCRGISYQTFGPGDPSRPEFWQPIFGFAASEFRRSDGKKLKVSFGCVDIGGMKGRLQ